MAALELLPAPAEMPPRSPGPFAFEDPDYINEILSSSGFSDVAIEREDFLHLPSKAHLQAFHAVFVACQDEAAQILRIRGPLAIELSAAVT